MLSEYAKAVATVTMILAVIGMHSALGQPPAGDSPGQSGLINPTDAKNLKNPVPNTRDSIKVGARLFANSCTQCHGTDGKAQIDVVAHATDLTSPTLYSHGTSEGEIFRTIRDGAGVAMPPFRSTLTRDEDIWSLVNFVRSLWPQDKRPPIVAGI
jgi:mono/diheme cytochrome c family protein